MRWCAAVRLRSARKPLGSWWYACPGATACCAHTSPSNASHPGAVSSGWCCNKMDEIHTWQLFHTGLNKHNCRAWLSHGARPPRVINSLLFPDWQRCYSNVAQPCRCAGACVGAATGGTAACCCCVGVVHERSTVGNPGDTCVGAGGGASPMLVGGGGSTAVGWLRRLRKPVACSCSPWRLTLTLRQTHATTRNT